MPTRRERIMKDAFPRIEKHLRETVQKEKWGTLETVVGTRKGKPSDNGGPSPVRPQDGKPRILSRSLLDQFDKGGQILTPVVRDWVAAIVRVSNRDLYDQLVVEEVGEVQADLDGVMAAIDTARDKLDVEAVSLLVNRLVRMDIDADEDLSDDVSRALLGGQVAPVFGMSKNEAWLIPHQAGDVVVERIRDLIAEWDYAADGGVELIATEQYVLARESKLKAFRLTLQL